MFRLLSVILLSLVFYNMGFPQASAAQNTWLVDMDGGGDFLDIQSAIDATVAGDVILVLPDSKGVAYAGFTINKGVVIRAIRNGFYSTFFVNSDVFISGVPAGEKAGLSGMLGVDFNVHVINCQGQVLLENIEIDRNFVGGTLFIDNCTNFLGNTITIKDLPNPNYGYGGNDGIVISHGSTVYLDNIDVAGQGAGAGEYPPNGGIGIKVANPIIGSNSAFVLISNPKTIIGGKGAIGVLFDTGLSCVQVGEASEGGVGIYAAKATVLVIGDPAKSLVQGGAGGGLYGDCGNGFSYPQALGIENLSSQITLSHTAVSGGGSYTTDNSLPFHSVTSNFILGGNVTQSMTAYNPGFVFFIYSDSLGKLSLQNWFGAPLAAIPGGGLFALIGGGRAQSGVPLNLSWTIQNNPAWLGYSLIMQAAIFEDSGRAVLDNPVARVIGQ